jgi:hypothetical protein
MAKKKDFSRDLQLEIHRDDIRRCNSADQLIPLSSGKFPQFREVDFQQSTNSGANVSTPGSAKVETSPVEWNWNPASCRTDRWVDLTRLMLCFAWLNTRQRMTKRAIHRSTFVRPVVERTAGRRVPADLGISGRWF